MSRRESPRTSSSLRILIADDHEVVRQGVKSLLVKQPGWEVCAEAANGREAVQKARQHKPQVAVLDITMPELNGLEAARQILKACPKTEVLILTVHESEQLVREILSAGAHGYVLKSDAGHDLVAAIESLSQGRTFFTSKVSKIVMQGLRSATTTRASTAERLELTPREREIIQLIAEGSSNKEVANTLGLSVKTVETHRTNLMRKLGLHSVVDVIHYAIRNRIIDA
jgi:DNA-binding NarL/FixJ family response regulator